MLKIAQHKNTSQSEFVRKEQTSERRQCGRNEDEICWINFYFIFQYIYHI